MSGFESKKEKILSLLSIPDGEYTDLSPKGTIDAGIRNLVDEINQLQGLVTTSSCAGRVAVFLEGSKKKSISAEDGDDQDGSDAIAGVGGKGGGRWLFVSHDPVDLQGLQKDADLLSILDLPTQDEQVPEGNELHDPNACQLLHLKFEPLILHILTSSLENAQCAFSAGMEAGFRESGIGSVTGSDPTPLVAIRTAGLAFDCVIGYATESGSIRLLVPPSYIRMMLTVANQRFVANGERRERFRQALLCSIAADKSESGKPVGWEPEDIRRERKRAEGLRRRDELLSQRQQQNQSAQKDDDAVVLGAFLEDQV